MSVSRINGLCLKLRPSLSDMNDTPSPLRLDGDRLYILDQTLLPFARQEVALETAAQAATPGS